MHSTYIQSVTCQKLPEIKKKWMYLCTQIHHSPPPFSSCQYSNIKLPQIKRCSSANLSGSTAHLVTLTVIEDECAHSQVSLWKKPWYPTVPSASSIWLIYSFIILISLSPSWEATNCAATQKLPWSLSWTRPIQSTPSHPLSKIHFNIVHPSTYVLAFLVVSASAFPPISYMHCSSIPFMLHARPI
jgi:hypothetical protein